MSGRILGVDPGSVSGAWAILDNSGRIVAVDDLPIVGAGTQRNVSAALFAATIERFRPSLVVIERVSAMPKQGVSSSFRFGRGVGLIEGVIGASLVPVIYTAPATWKRFYGLPSDKETCRQRAVERWPESAAAFSRKRDHNRAEAAFIASWGLSARTVVGAVS